MLPCLKRSRPAPEIELAPGAAVEAARGLNRAASMLARRCYGQRGRALPRLVPQQGHVRAAGEFGLVLLAGLHGHADRRLRPHRARDAVFAAAALVGLVGTGAHLYNIAKKPGGFRFQNLFYSAPVGAPAALILSDCSGSWASGRGTMRPTRPRPSPASPRAGFWLRPRAPASWVRSAKRACCTIAAPIRTRSCISQ